MGSRSEWFCWEIMQCKNPDGCPAKKNPHTPCWEIAREKADYRHALNICRDCIVHIIRVGNPALSSQEIMEIMKTKTQANLADDDSCPAVKVETFDRLTTGYPGVTTRRLWVGQPHYGENVKGSSGCQYN